MNKNTDTITKEPFLREEKKEFSQKDYSIEMTSPEHQFTEQTDEKNEIKSICCFAYLYIFR